jgi:hypothetical protein
MMPSRPSPLRPCRHHLIPFERFPVRLSITFTLRRHSETVQYWDEVALHRLFRRLLTRHSRHAFTNVGIRQTAESITPERRLPHLICHLRREAHMELEQKPKSQKIIVPCSTSLPDWQISLNSLIRRHHTSQEVPLHRQVLTIDNLTTLL